LAFQCGLYDESEKLIYRALAGEPSASIAVELRLLLEDVSFRRHLAVRGVQLSNVDVQVVIEGNGIGYGIAPTAEVISRVTGTNLLLFRTAERLAKRDYREAGPPTNEIRDVAESFMTMPRAASYAFSIRVGRTTQMSFDDPSELLLNELLDCLVMIEDGNEANLKDRIQDAAYYNNFVALAKGILPDGDRVKTVGFTVQRDGRTREVALRHTAAEIRGGFTPLLSPDTKRVAIGKEKTVEVSGQLKLADSTHESNKIRLVSEHKSVTVLVPEGMMTDIVKPLWNEWVIIQGLKMGRSISLSTIRKMT
jgi:hypothetical protein